MIKVLMQEKIFKTLNACRANDKDGREVLQALHITKNHIEATDGRMLVRATRENAGIPESAKPGVYKIIAAGKKDIGGFIEAALELLDMEYPNTDAVMPGRGKQADQFNIIIRGSKADILSISSAILMLYKKTGNGYAGHLLDRLAGLGESWTTGAPGENKPIRLDCEALGEKLTAVIMPFQVG